MSRDKFLWLFDHFISEKKQHEKMKKKHKRCQFYLFNGQSNVKCYRLQILQNSLQPRFSVDFPFAIEFCVYDPMFSSSTLDIQSRLKCVLIQC